MRGAQCKIRPQPASHIKYYKNLTLNVKDLASIKWSRSIAVAMATQVAVCSILKVVNCSPITRTMFTQHHPPTTPCTRLSVMALKATPWVSLFHLSSHLNTTWSAQRQKTTSPAELSTIFTPSCSCIPATYAN